jgi:hypothetical protein
MPRTQFDCRPVERRGLVNIAHFAPRPMALIFMKCMQLSTITACIAQTSGPRQRKAVPKIDTGLDAIEHCKGKHKSDRLGSDVLGRRHGLPRGGGR